MTVFTVLNGTTLQHERPLQIQEVKFPSNWLDYTTTDSDLATRIITMAVVAVLYEDAVTVVFASKSGTHSLTNLTSLTQKMS